MNRNRSGLLGTRTLIKHDLTRRRTLKHRSVLLKQYGIYALSLTYLGFGVYFVNKWVNPPEFKTQEEREKSQVKFGMSDLITRTKGYITAFRE